MRKQYQVALVSTVFSVFIFLGNAQALQAKTTIVWELENSFRMFLDPTHTRVHQDEYDNLTEQEKKNPILSIERRLAKKHPFGWAEKMYKLTCWDKKRRSYKRCRGKKKDYLHPKSHKILAKLGSLKNISGQCVWSVRDKKTPEQRLLQSVKAACNKEVSLNIPYPSGAIVKVVSKGESVAKEVVKVTDLFIVGLGDSFGSGEGNPDNPVKFNNGRFADYGLIVGQSVRLNHFPARIGRWRWIGDRKFSKKKARWQSQACHRSLYSHQLRVALQLASEDKKRAVTFAGFACSGAEILVGLLDTYKGNDWDRYKPKNSQISSAVLSICGPNEAQFNTYTTTFTYGGRLPTMENLGLYKCGRKKGKKYRKIDFLLVSVGGNDVGFARLVANAILKDKTALKSLSGWMGHVYKTKEAVARLDELALRYKAANRAFHNILYIPWEQSDRIILTAYPKIGYREDGKTICPDGNQGMDLHPVFNVNSRKVEEGEKFSSRLVEFMKDGAKRHGWSFVDEHRKDFSSHGYCAVNGHSENNGESFSIPRKIDGVWKPYEPTAYRPYQSRQRWIRTPNDVYMSTHQHLDRLLIRKVLRTKNLNPFQLIYAGTYGGSFHPTAEGQAVIADAVLRKIHVLLKKYKY